MLKDEREPLLRAVWRHQTETYWGRGYDYYPITAMVEPWLELRKRGYIKTHRVQGSNHCIHGARLTPKGRRAIGVAA